MIAQAYRGLGAWKQQENAVTGDVDDAAVASLGFMTNNPEAGLDLACGRDVVVLDQTRVARDIRMENGVHAAIVAAYRQRDLLPAGVQLQAKQYPVRELDEVSVTQSELFANGNAIDQRQIHRAQMGEHQPPIRPGQLGMGTRNGRMIDLHVAVWRAADRGFAGAEGILRLACPGFASGGDQNAGRRKTCHVVRQWRGLRNG